jgi:hypothetical protein
MVFNKHVITKGNFLRLMNFSSSPRIHYQYDRLDSLVHARPSIFGGGRDIDDAKARTRGKEIRWNTFPGLIRINQSPGEGAELRGHEIGGLRINTLLDEEMAPLLEVPYDGLLFRETST